MKCLDDGNTFAVLRCNIHPLVATSILLDYKYSCASAFPPKNLQIPLLFGEHPKWFQPGGCFSDDLQLEIVSYSIVQLLILQSQTSFFYLCIYLYYTYLYRMHVLQRWVAIPAFHGSKPDNFSILVRYPGALLKNINLF